MKYSFSTTKDNSLTITNNDLGETYHSVHGAIQESRQIYIDIGLMPFIKNSQPEINVFEMGFGTGLNCFLTYILSGNSNINYHSIEKFILPDEIVKQLNYSNLISNKESQIFQNIHNCDWDIEHKIAKNFCLYKIAGDILNHIFPENYYDVIYYDAFSPNTQANLWTQEIFQKIYCAMKIGGILTTYCCKGEVKRNLLNIGFKVEKLPGPPGKREIIKALKIN